MIQGKLPRPYILFLFSSFSSPLPSFIYSFLVLSIFLVKSIPTKYILIQKQISFCQALKLDDKVLWTYIFMERSLFERKYVHVFLSVLTFKWKGDSFWLPSIAPWKTSVVLVQGFLFAEPQELKVYLHLLTEK